MVFKCNNDVRHHAMTMFRIFSLDGTDFSSGPFAGRTYHIVGNVAAQLLCLNVIMMFKCNNDVQI